MRDTIARYRRTGAVRGAPWRGVPRARARAGRRVGRRYTARHRGRLPSPLGLLQVIALALMQGLTEFLPISTSAHLVLPSMLLGWPQQGLALDVALHAG